MESYRGMNPLLQLAMSREVFVFSLLSDTSECRGRKRSIASLVEAQNPENVPGFSILS